VATSKHKHFDIDASIVFQLGEDLITDVVQALVELVKNAYDADATYVKITVDTKSIVTDESSFFPQSQGFVLIEDNGVGMDETTIQKGWLTISKSPKREMKRSNATTQKGRTPLGDKGLGRLGAQRLGLNIELFTTPKGATITHHVGWAWQAFRTEQTLMEVPINWDTSEGTQRRGTRLLISSLREPEQWEGSAFARVAAELSQMISPYSEIQNFAIQGTVNGKELELAEISERVRKGAQVRYKLRFDGKVFHIDGRARLDLLRPSSAKDAEAFEQLVDADGGAAFLEFLESQNHATQCRLKRARSQEWFVEFALDRPFGDIDKLERTAATDALPLQPFSPGPFQAEIDAFDLGRSATAKQSVFDTAADYRQHIKTLSGVRIYRDGFGVRVDRDWLGLGKQWTSASSYYGLKPDNTLGFVTISARDNAALVETTDREGFKDTQAYRNFVRLFEVFVDFAHDTQEFLRRSWLAFKKDRERQLADVETDATPETLAETVATGLKRVASFQSSIASVKTRLDEARNSSDAVMNKLREESPENAAIVKQCKQVRDEMQKRFGEAHAVLDEVRNEIASASRLYDVQRVVEGQIATLREQLLQGVEAMSLGLTTEVLAHEIANICDQLAARNTEISAYLSRKGIGDERITSYVEHVRSTTNGLRRQLGHLTPSLKYARTTRKIIDLTQYGEELRDYHKSRWKDVSIDMRLDVARPMSVKINQGKLTQVLDNLILNSDYWLREDIKAGRIEKGLITLRVSEPHVLVFDNGTGIDPVVESSLFEPFVTCKRNGRGLGLFVARQLLESEGCQIRIRPRRNSANRLYQFEIDLSECINNGG